MSAIKQNVNTNESIYKKRVSEIIGPTKTLSDKDIEAKIKDAESFNFFSIFKEVFCDIFPKNVK